MSALGKASQRVLSSMGMAEAMMGALHIKQPNGWQWQYMTLRRAYQSGYLARFGPTFPNYTRLLQAATELEMATKHDRNFDSMLWG